MRDEQWQRAAADAFRQIGVDEHGVDPGHGQRGALVDAADFRVSVGTAHERRVQHAGKLDVVDVTAFPAEQRGVLLALDGSAKPLARALFAHRAVSRARFAAISAASTMPW
jgi:hypothetical protein